MVDIVSASLRLTLGWAVDPDPLPAFTKGVCLRYAAALYDNPLGLASQVVGSTTASYSLSMALANDPDVVAYLGLTVA